MTKEIENSPVLLRARTLQSLGILVYHYPNSYSFGTAVTDEEGPLRVQSMGVRSLRRELAEYNKVVENSQAILDESFQKREKTLDALRTHFVAAGVMSGAYLASVVSGGTPLVQRLIGGGVIITTILGGGTLVAHWSDANQRNDRMISQKIAIGNAELCANELRRRGRALRSHGRLSSLERASHLELSADLQ